MRKEHNDKDSLLLGHQQSRKDRTRRCWNPNKVCFHLLSFVLFLPFIFSLPFLPNSGRHTTFQHLFQPLLHLVEWRKALITRAGKKLLNSAPLPLKELQELELLFVLFTPQFSNLPSPKPPFLFQRLLRSSFLNQFSRKGGDSTCIWGAKRQNPILRLYLHLSLLLMVWWNHPKHT